MKGKCKILMKRFLCALLILMMLTGNFVYAAPWGDFNPKIVTDFQNPYDPDVYYVYYNGNIYTEMDEPDKPFKTAEAIVTLDQWIVYVGDDDSNLADWIAAEELAKSVNIGNSSEPGADAVWIDLKGETVLPGMHDSHIHIESGGNTLSMPDIFWKPKAEILSIIAAEAAKKPAGEWIQARGWNQTLETWDGGKTDFPTKEELDAVAPNNPVALTRTDSHAMWVNSMALEMVDIYKDGKINNLPDPEGGVIIRDEKGEATGVLVDTAFWPVRDVIPEADEAENIRRLYDVQQHCFKHGITSVMNAGSQMDSINRIMNEYETGDDLKLRIYLEIRSYHDGIQNDILFREQISSEPLINEYDYRFTARATKVTLDGALGSRGASLLEPYSDAGQDGTQPGYKGATLRFTDEQLYDLFKRNFEAGFTFSGHCIGDAANEQYLRVYEKFLIDEEYIDVDEDGMWNPADVKALDLRPRIEHFQITAPDHIERAAALAITPSMQFVHATSDMSMAGIRVGEERLSHAYAWRKVLDAGMEIANGTDWSVDLINPFHGLYAAVTRLDRNGNSPRGEGIPWNPIDTATTDASDERLTRAEALHAYTYGGAYAQFEEDIKGTLEVGKLADFIVIDRDYFDPVECPDFKIKDINAVMTVLGGEVVYVMEEPTITSLSLGNGVVDTPYIMTLYATGSPTLEWRIIEMDEELEGWLKINSHSGELSGVPTTAGTYELTVMAENYLGSDTKVMTISIDAKTSTEPDVFDDVKAEDWFYDSVQYVYANNLMKGTGIDPMTFSPHATTTRGMVATILYRMEGSPAVEEVNPFNDVAPEQYYANPITWASANSIVLGYGNDLFGPDDPITREQMALILMNYAKLKEYDVTEKSDLSIFNDFSSVSQWALDALAWANAKGLIQGSDNNNLMPVGNAERCQVAAILQRFIEMEK
jgi:predicted amidohydrolase YtcJ